VVSSIPSEKVAASGSRSSPLYLEQVWLVRLRWVAGAVAAGVGLLDWQYAQWFSSTAAIPILGAVILAYNVIFWWQLRVARTHGSSAANLKGLAWLQILLDLACLTCLTLWTGGYRSPLTGLYVLHMVFASLLLPRVMAFAVCGAAIIMLQLGLALTNNWPTDRATQLVAAGWVVALLSTVYLANRITRSLRENQRRLKRQNRRIRAMSARLRRQQQALIQQEKLVAMGQMAAGVAHEVANPLASMDGLLQLLERRPERVTPENLMKLREQIARINQIVRQLTSFAHPGDHGWETSSLNEVVKRAMNVIRFDQRLKDVKVEYELDGELPASPLQPVALEQVVINLVINALDAMEESVEKRLILRTRQAEGACVLEIQDTGHGVAKEHVGRLFEPFFTTKPVGKGTGLGLSISYSLIRKHGGAIRVENGGGGVRGGSGAKFVVTIPLGQAGQGASREREAVSHGISTPENPGA